VEGDPYSWSRCRDVSMAEDRTTGPAASETRQRSVLCDGRRQTEAVPRRRPATQALGSADSTKTQRPAPTHKGLPLTTHRNSFACALRAALKSAFLRIVLARKDPVWLRGYIETKHAGLRVRKQPNNPTEPETKR